MRSRDRPPRAHAIRSLASEVVVGARIAALCLAGILVMDLLMWRLRPTSWAQAIIDESAHFATGVVALAAVPRVRLSMVAAVLGASVLIDLDHLPGLLGSNALQGSLPRPYTHALWLPAALLALCAARRRIAPMLVVVIVAALVLHFVRDLAEPGGPGVSLLWPISDHPYSIGYGYYAALLLVLAAPSFRRAAKGRRQSSDGVASVTVRP